MELTNEKAGVTVTFDEINRLNEDLFFILTDKTEGESLVRVMGVPSGDGFLAYQKVHKWYAGISGLGIAERARQVMHPSPPKREEEVAGALERWAEQVKFIEKHGAQYKLNTVFKYAALKMILVGDIKRYYEAYLESHVKVKPDEDDFDRDLKQVLEFAVKKRLEDRRTHDPMDVGHVDDQSHQHDHEEEGSCSNDHWGVDAVGKGKGKGKGGKGKSNVQCWICGQYGHVQSECPKGKGKGKTCWHCGKPGHLARDCPSNPKGKGKGNKGKGKGMYGFGEDPWSSGWNDAVFDLGGEVNEVQPQEGTQFEWQVPVRSARSQWDMRPAFGVERMSTGNIAHVSKPPSELMGVWERVEVTVDSGAVDTVGPPTVAQGNKVTETRASKAGMRYMAANGSPIENHGQKAVKGFTDGWNPICMTMQVADVNKVLASVKRICEAGNTVTFDSNGGVIWNRATGKTTRLEEKGGTYSFNMWLPRAQAKKGVETVNRFAALAEEEEDNNMDF